MDKSIKMIGINNLINDSYTISLLLALSTMIKHYQGLAIWYFFKEWFYE